jgi:hypothetical protein
MVGLPVPELIWVQNLIGENAHPKQATCFWFLIVIIESSL